MLFATPPTHAVHNCFHLCWLNRTKRMKGENDEEEEDEHITPYDFTVDINLFKYIRLFIVCAHLE